MHNFSRQINNTKLNQDFGFLMEGIGAELEIAEEEKTQIIGLM